MPDVEEYTKKGYYSRITERVNYKVLAAIPPVITAVMVVVLLVNGVELGIDFKGGTWIEVLTDRGITPDTQAQIQASLVDAGFDDVKLYVGWDVGSGKNKITIATINVVNKTDVTPLLAPYVGELLESDVARGSYAGKPSADLPDRLSAILKQRVDVGYEGGVLTVTALDLEAESLESALEYAGGVRPDMIVEKKNFNSRTVGPTLGKTFREQGVKAIIAAYILITVVVFFAFRNLVPSVAVLQAAVCDPLIAFGLMSVFGIPLEPATLAALLMLIGYSVDSDILITSRVLKRRGVEVNQSIDGAMNTGLFMTGTTIVVMIVMIVVSSTLTQIMTLYNIALVLLLGLIVDLMTTWFTNAGILKWYLEVPGGRKIFGRR
ncbi:MAG: protein translocase subunit SecF [Candidatus Altiarchaeota archaeon]